MGFPFLQLFVSVYGWRPNFSFSSGPPRYMTTMLVGSLRSTATSMATATVAAVCTPTTLGEALSHCSPPLPLPPLPTPTAAPLVDVVASASAIQGNMQPTGGPAGGLEFLPLMLTSVYCAIGLLWAFGRLSWIYLYRTNK